MKNTFFQKFDYISFISNMLAVILGIVITFSIQSLLDNKAERENVTSALILVRDELTTARSELSSCADFLDLEGQGAEYILRYKDDLISCHHSQWLDRS